MHLLAATTATIDDLIEPVDLGQSPGDIVVLSFTDSDLAGLAAAWAAGPWANAHSAGPSRGESEQSAARTPAAAATEKSGALSLRLAHLRDLRHPMSVDLWLDKMASKVVLVRLLGGLDWWRYGAERLAELARARGIALIVLPGILVTVSTANGA